MIRMQKFSLLIFSKNDVDQALELVSEMFGLADDIVLMDASSDAEKRRLKAAARHYSRKLRVFDVVALG